MRCNAGTGVARHEQENLAHLVSEEVAKPDARESSHLPLEPPAASSEVARQPAKDAHPIDRPQSMPANGNPERAAPNTKVQQSMTRGLPPTGRDQELKPKPPQPSAKVQQPDSQGFKHKAISKQNGVLEQNGIGKGDSKEQNGTDRGESKVKPLDVGVTAELAALGVQTAPVHACAHGSVSGPGSLPVPQAARSSAARQPPKTGMHPHVAFPWVFLAPSRNIWEAEVKQLVAVFLKNIPCRSIG